MNRVTTSALWCIGADGIGNAVTGVVNSKVKITYKSD